MESNVEGMLDDSPAILTGNNMSEGTNNTHAVSQNEDIKRNDEYRMSADQECDKMRHSEKELLISKLKKIPIEKLREIITSQIDLEIRLKHKELKLIEEEIGKCESQMITLRNFFQAPSHLNLPEEPKDFTVKYYDLLNKSLSISYSNLSGIAEGGNKDGGMNQDISPKYTYRTRSTTSSLRPPKQSYKSHSISGCVYKRTDSVLVKLTCPDCQRSNFSSAQGFLNHSRIAHSKEYTSQDGAALQCGTVLPDEDQDEEGLASLQSLKLKNLDPNSNLNIDEIYFNGLSNSLNTVHDSSHEKGGHNYSTPFTQSPDHKVTTSHLMKKLISEGVMKNEKDYNELLSDTATPVKRSHLFDDEEEVDNNEDTAKFKKRKSRSASIGHASFSSSHEPLASASSNPPLPKLKLRIRNCSKSGSPDTAKASHSVQANTKPSEPNSSNAQEMMKEVVEASGLPHTSNTTHKEPVPSGENITHELPNSKSTQNLMTIETRSMTTKKRDRKK